MRKFKEYFLIAVVFAAAAAVVNADAEPYNPSTRSLNSMARRGNPIVSLAALKDVCPTVKNVTGKEFLWKSEISKHISPGDRRASGPTFICNRLCPKKFPMSFFYSDGEKAGSVGYYGTYRVTGKPRAYCAAGGAPQCSIKSITANAKKAGRDGYVYVKISDSTCYKVRPLGRTGSA